jgi:hypothetical protein
MKVDYDSEAHSILFEFGSFHVFEEGDYVELLGDDQCIVGFHDGRVDNIQLLNVDGDLTLLDEAAVRFGLDAEALGAAARAALAGPDREINIEVGKDLAAEHAEAETARATQLASTGVTRPSG